MQTTTLIILFILLVIILLVLVIFYTKEDKPSSTKKKKSASKNASAVKTPTFKELYEIIKSKSSSEKALQKASEDILKHYAIITPKLGARAHPDFDKYATMIMSLSRHPNTSKNIILNFDKNLQKKNPSYAHEIETYLAKGLNSRGL